MPLKIGKIFHYNAIIKVFAIGNYSKLTKYTSISIHLRKYGI